MHFRFMNSKNINIISALYIVLPVLIFFAGWLKLWIAIPALIICIISLYFFIRQERRKKESVTFSFLNLIPVFIILVVWVYFSGAGGYVAQTSDYAYRNGIFNLLVEKDWPVIVGTRGLIYYIGFWLPAALVGKIMGMAAGITFQAIWAGIGIFLVFCLIFEHLGKVSVKAVLMFIFFSGLDILGAYIVGWQLPSLDSLHIEWWSGFQYSSFTTQLFWVFNQAIYGWIITLMVMKQKSNRFVIFIWSCGLLSCTFQFAGLLPFVIYRICKNMREGSEDEAGQRAIIENDQREKKGVVSFCKKTEFFSFANILGGGCIGIITFLYLISNISASNTGTAENSVAINNYVVMYLLFIMLEVGVYWFTIYAYQYKNVLFWLCGAVLLICPLIRVGSSIDFCMRASIPALLILMIMVMDSLREAKKEKNWVIVIALSAILLIGAVDPAIEFGRTAVQTAEMYETNHAITNLIVQDSTVMSEPNFSGEVSGSFFFKYLSS